MTPSAPDPRPGCLIVLEGIDGVGKSTQARALVQALRDRGHTVVQSREPTDGPHGRALRASQVGQRLDPRDELELFLKDRREHVEQLIQPALQRGEIVVLDRYYPSTVAYQGARGFQPHTLLQQNEAFAPRPDLLLILDLDPDQSLQRILDKRGQAADSFEVPHLLERSRHIFLQLASLLPNAHLIDATQPAETITAQLLALAVQTLERQHDSDS